MNQDTIDAIDSVVKTTTNDLLNTLLDTGHAIPLSKKTYTEHTTETGPFIRIKKKGYILNEPIPINITYSPDHKSYPRPSGNRVVFKDGSSIDI
jgi:hypothetical protein